jgi:hypothetical protein
MGITCSKKQDKLRYIIDEQGNEVFSDRIYPENWVWYLKKLWHSQDMHKDFRSAVKMVVLGSQMELFEGTLCTLQKPFIKNAGASEGDLLVGFKLHTPESCAVSLYINDTHIQEIHLDVNTPKIAIAGAYPINLLHMFSSTITLAGKKEFEITPVFAVLNTTNRRKLAWENWYIPETKSTDIIHFRYGDVRVIKNICPDSISLEGYLMPYIGKRSCFCI